MSKYENGHPGGPGRPRGSRNRAYAAYDELVREGMEKVLRAMIEAAANGDTQAARLLFARAWPAAREQRVEMDLPALLEPADLVAAHAELMQAVGSGDLSPEQASELGEVLNGQRLAIETTEMEVRLAALEEKYGLAPSR